MGTRVGPRHRVDSLTVRVLRNDGGPIAQLLHPWWVARDDARIMGSILEEVESTIADRAPDIRLVLTGGGFVELWPGSGVVRTPWRSERALRQLLSLVKTSMQPIAEALSHAKRDYVIGVDTVLRKRGVGQFAVVLAGGQVTSVVWKSYPVDDEAQWLAGFGTAEGRRAPRFVATALGKSLVLVCHDSQVFNHRNQALVHRAYGTTPRMLSMDEMRRHMERERPQWALDLIHHIGKRESIRTFSTSFKQICEDHEWRPRAIGAFGYGSAVYYDLAALSKKAQYPPGSAKCTLVVEAAQLEG